MSSRDLQITIRELQGKQSVRATFVLSEEIIALLKNAAQRLGVKQKSLLDQLVDDQQVLRTVAEEAQDIGKTDVPRRQKTFVISRKALTALDDISASCGIARDLLLESSIARLASFVQAEQEKQQCRGKLLIRMKQFLDDGKDLLSQAERTLERDDRLRVRLAKIIQQLDKSIGEMQRLASFKKK